MVFDEVRTDVLREMESLAALLNLLSEYLSAVGISYYLSAVGSSVWNCAVIKCRLGNERIHIMETYKNNEL